MMLSMHPDLPPIMNTPANLCPMDIIDVNCGLEDICNGHHVISTTPTCRWSDEETVDVSAVGF